MYNVYIHNVICNVIILGTAVLRVQWAIYNLTASRKEKSALRHDNNNNSLFTTAIIVAANITVLL